MVVGFELKEVTGTRAEHPSADTQELLTYVVLGGVNVLIL